MKYSKLVAAFMLLFAANCGPEEKPDGPAGENGESSLAAESSQDEDLSAEGGLTLDQIKEISSREIGEVRARRASMIESGAPRMEWVRFAQDLTDASRRYATRLRTYVQRTGEKNTAVLQMVAFNYLQARRYDDAFKWAVDAVNAAEELKDSSEYASAVMLLRDVAFEAQKGIEDSAKVVGEALDALGSGNAYLEILQAEFYNALGTGNIDAAHDGFNVFREKVDNLAPEESRVWRRIVNETSDALFYLRSWQNVGAPGLVGEISESEIVDLASFQGSVLAVYFMRKDFDPLDPCVEKLRELKVRNISPDFHAIGFYIDFSDAELELVKSMCALPFTISKVPSNVQEMWDIRPENPGAQVFFIDRDHMIQGVNPAPSCYETIVKDLLGK
ncbi:MAG: peroxiredoxin family protein [Planctomycetes bacterium]|nr:peroxiredoxin family protein [Planctomycetota bacterium]